MGVVHSQTELEESVQLPAGGSFVIADEIGTELFRVTADGDMVRIVSGLVPRAPIDFSTILPSGTAGSLMTTGSTWVPFTVAGACGQKLLLENRCNTGEFASLRIRGRAKNTTADGNGGNSVGTTTAIDASASAIQAEYGNLKAVNAVAQPNALAQSTDASNIVSALYGRIDATAASVGRRWVTWIDTHATTKADASDYLVRLSHNGTVAIDGLFTIYQGGRTPVLFNFEDASGCLADADASLTVQSGAIAVKTPAGTKYIPLYNAAA